MRLPADFLQLESLAEDHRLPVGSEKGPMFCRGRSFTEGRNEGSLVRQPTRAFLLSRLKHGDVWDATCHACVSECVSRNTVTSALGPRASADLAAVRFSGLGQRTTEMLKLGFSLKGLRATV